MYNPIMPTHTFRRSGQKVAVYTLTKTQGGYIVLDTLLIIWDSKKISKGDTKLHVLDMFLFVACSERDQQIPHLSKFELFQLENFSGLF